MNKGNRKRWEYIDESTGSARMHDMSRQLMALDPGFPLGYTYSEEASLTSSLEAAMASVKVPQPIFAEPRATVHDELCFASTTSLTPDVSRSAACRIWQSFMALETHCSSQKHMARLACV